jgi:hypothetical protein
MVVIMDYYMDDRGRYSPGRKRANQERTFAEEELSDYRESASRNICHIFRSMQTHRMK